MSALFPGQGNARFVDIILPLNMPQVLTYGVPHDWDELLLPGMRVEVALGRNKKFAGIILRIHEEVPETYEVKPVLALLDDVPIVNEKQLRFWQWIAHYYAAAPGEVMQAALPAHLKLIGETRLQWAPKYEHTDWSAATWPVVEILKARKSLTISDLKSITGGRKISKVLNELLEKEAIIINDSLEPTYKKKTEKVVTLHPDYRVEGVLKELFEALNRSPKQLELLMCYLSLSTRNKTIRQQELLEHSGGTAAQVKALADKGIFIVEDQEVDRVVFSGEEEQREIHLTPPQQAAWEALEQGLSEKDVLLLQGVTGSGKTLLYIQKIRECLANGQQALFLLPEIGLTTQLVRRLYAYFGKNWRIPFPLYQ